MDGSYYNYKGSGVADNFHFYFDPDPTDSYDYSGYYDGRFTITDIKGKYTALPLGMTIKVASHSWLMAGISLEIPLDGYYIGTLEFSVDGSPYKLYSKNAVTRGSGEIGFEAQLGANFVFNFIDLGVITSYNFVKKSFAVDLCAGVAF